MALAWLTLIGAAIGIRSRAHFTLHFMTPMLSSSVRRANRHRQPSADRRHRRTDGVVRLGSVQAQLDADDSGAGDQPRLALRVRARRRLADRRLCAVDDRCSAAPRPERQPLGPHDASVVRRGHFRGAAAAVDADRVLAGGRGRRRPLDGRLSHATAALGARLGLAELGPAGHPGLRVRRRPDGAVRHEPRAGRVRALARRLGARRSRHVGDRRRLLLLRHLRIEDGGGLRAGLLADAAAHQGRLQEGQFGLDDRGRNRHGHAGAAGDLHDRDRAGHQHLGGDAVSRRLLSGLRHHDLPDGPRLSAGPQVRLAGRRAAELAAHRTRRRAGGGAAGGAGRHPRRVLLRDHHRDRSRRGGCGLCLPRRQALLSQCLLAARWQGSPTTAPS